MGTTTAALLLERLNDGNNQILTIQRDGYHLRAVPGRSGSVCFTLEQEAHDGPILLAEGFSLENEMVYDQCHHPEDMTERILRWVLQTPVIVRTPAIMPGQTATLAAADD